MRIGVLTGGGDCPGLNAVIRGIVRKGINQSGHALVGFRHGWAGVLKNEAVELTNENTRGILHRGGTILGSSRTNPFKVEGGVDQVKESVRQRRLDALIPIGGEDTLGVARRLVDEGVPVVGVPKTIDNDLSATAYTFGFASAVACATDALDRLHTTAASHERTMVLEVMGRHAGWIALDAGIAGGGDVILIPEIPWTFENICHKILDRAVNGKNFSLIVVAEGAHLPSGEMVGEERRGAQLKLGGIGPLIAREIEARLHREARTVVLGHLQRGGAPTTFDRVLATQYGAHAVRLIVEKRFGEMICYNPPDMGSVPIIEAVHQIRTVEPDGPAVQAARALGISFGDCEAGQSPFVCRVDDTDVTTAEDVEADADFVLDIAEAAAEEALLDS